MAFQKTDVTIKRQSDIWKSILVIVVFIYSTSHDSFKKYTSNNTLLQHIL